MKYLIGILLASIAQMVFAGEIYTCKVNGSTVYQGKPCAGSKELNKQVRDAQKRYTDQKAQAAKQQAEWDSKKEPSIGMTTKQVENSTWGYPQKYSETKTVNGVSEFWHYGSGRMVYFRNGVVVSLTQ